MSKWPTFYCATNSSFGQFFLSQNNVKNWFYYFGGNLRGEGVEQKIVHNLQMNPPSVSNLWVTLIFSRESNSSIANVCLSVRPSIIKTPQPLRIITISHHAIMPSCHHAYQPSCLLGRSNKRQISRIDFLSLEQIRKCIVSFIFAKKNRLWPHLVGGNDVSLFSE